MSHRFGGFPTYTEYLQSPHWKGLRKALCLKPDSKCGGCDSKHHLQIHHISYERLGSELPDDLVVLCEWCHKRVHDELDRLYPARTTAFKALRTAYIFPLLFERPLAREQTKTPSKLSKAARRKKRKKGSRARKAKKAAAGRYATLPVNFERSKIRKRRKKPGHLKPLSKVIANTFKARQPDVRTPRLQPRPENTTNSVLSKMFGLRESRG